MQATEAAAAAPPAAAACAATGSQPAADAGDPPSPAADTPSPAASSGNASERDLQSPPAVTKSPSLAAAPEARLQIEFISNKEVRWVLWRGAVGRSEAAVFRCSRAPMLPLRQLHAPAAAARCTAPPTPSPPTIPPLPARPQAALLSWFVYLATVLIVGAVVALVVLKFVVDERQALFRSTAW